MPTGAASVSTVGGRRSSSTVTGKTSSSTVTGPALPDDGIYDGPGGYDEALPYD